MSGGQAGSAEDLQEHLQRIERKINDLVGLHTHTKEIGEELFITPEMLTRATPTQLWDWIHAFRVELPTSVLRMAVQRHLQKYCELVEAIPETPESKRPPRPPKASPPPLPWTPEKGLHVIHVSDKDMKGTLGITKKGTFTVRWKNGTKSKYQSKKKLYENIRLRGNSEAQPTA